MHDPAANVRTGHADNGRTRQHERPVVSPVRIVQGMRSGSIMWYTMENGRKRARLPRAV